MNSKIIICRYGRPSPIAIMGMSLLVGALFFLTLPFLLFFFLILGISTAYMTWRLKRVLDAHVREQQKNCHYPRADFTDVYEESTKAVIIDITPENPPPEKDVPAIPASTN